MARQRNATSVPTLKTASTSHRSEDREPSGIPRFLGSTNRRRRPRPDTFQ